MKKLSPKALKAIVNEIEIAEFKRGTETMLGVDALAKSLTRAAEHADDVGTVLVRMEPSPVLYIRQFANALREAAHAAAGKAYGDLRTKMEMPLLYGGVERRAPKARCVGCGCTEARACDGGCGWARVWDERRGLCSACAARMA